MRPSDDVRTLLPGPLGECPLVVWIDALPVKNPVEGVVRPRRPAGRIVFEGTPADLVAARSTLTGEHLAAYVGV